MAVAQLLDQWKVLIGISVGTWTALCSVRSRHPASSAGPPYQYQLSDPLILMSLLLYCDGHRR